MKKVLILGASGMLGSMVFDYLNQQKEYYVRASLRDKSIFKQKKEQGKFYLFDVERDNIQKKIFSNFKPDYIINCIGATKPFCKDDDPEGIFRAIRINSDFPYNLAGQAEKIDAKVIQIASDCVYSGKEGNYLESAPHDALDVYGKTKSLGEVIKDNFLNIRCSIIGPEIKNKLSLLEWFLSQPAGEKLKGFSHHQWNGVTTLQFAKVCQRIIDKGEGFFKLLRQISPAHHFVPNTSVSKYQLLNIFKKVFDKDIKIEQVNNIGPSVDRTLATEFNLLVNNKKLIPTEKAIQELKDYQWSK